MKYRIMESENILTKEELEAYKRYRVRSSVITAIAVAMYIVCWLPLVILPLVAERRGGYVEVWGLIGLGITTLIIAVATAMLIVFPSLKPAFMKEGKIIVDVNDYGEDEEHEEDDVEKVKIVKRRRSPLFSAVINSFWTLVVAAYLCMGFIWGLWHPGWIIFIVGSSVEGIIEVILYALDKKKAEDKKE